MGEINELKATNGRSIPDRSRGSVNKTEDPRHSESGVGRRTQAERSGDAIQTDEGGNLASGDKSLESQPSTPGVRASLGSAVQISGIPGQAVGSNSSQHRNANTPGQTTGQKPEIGLKRMKTLVTAIQKGGQGKTFATCHLAFDFQERGLRVAVIDLDSQGNASFTLSESQSGYLASQLFNGDTDALRYWFGQRDNAGLSVLGADSALANLDRMELPQAAAALRASIAVLGEFFDVCLIDTAPSLGVAMTAALLSADYMLSPLEMEAYSLQGMKKMVAVVGNLRKLNPKLTFLGLLPNMVNAKKPRQMENLRLVQAAYPQLVLPFSIGDRDSIAEALGELKQPVWKIKKTAARKASQEVRAMANYVFTKMEISQ